MHPNTFLNYLNRPLSGRERNIEISTHVINVSGFKNRIVYEAGIMHLARLAHFTAGTPPIII